MDSTSKILNTSSRFNEIVTILTNYGIADWLSGSKNEWVKNQLKKSTGKDLSKYTHEERIRLALTEMGTTFIKLGQVLSTRTDLISLELIKELSKLQASTPPDGIAKVRKQIKKEFDVKSVDDLFASFETKSIASASIAQVHKATLHSGEEVVVKVMREGIEEKVREDLNIMVKLAAMAEKHVGGLKAFQPLAMIRQFSQTMLNELDFNLELKNLVRFDENFAEDDRVYFPKAYKEVSGKTVLTMSYLEGIPLSSIDDLDWTNNQKSQFTEQSADIFMEMMFRDRFYHADPHPGNLFVREDGSLGILDCGMVSKVDSKTNAVFEELIIGVSEKNAEHIKNTIVDMCTVPKTVDFDALTLEIDQFLEKYLDVPLNEFDMSAAINEGILIIQRFGLILPANVSSLFRVVVMLEGTSRSLNPEFNITVLFKKYHSKILKRRYAPKALGLRLAKNIHLWEQVIDQAPKTLNKLLRNVGRDDFEINLEHRNLEKSVNRIVLGMITSAIFLGSSLLWAFKVPPQFNGYSIFGIIGVGISTILAYKLIKDLINKL